MCTRYVSPSAADIERMWHVGRTNPWRGQEADVYPGYQAPFIRSAKDGQEGMRELLQGRFGLIPWFAKSTKQTYATHNARFEELTSKASFKHPWARGQRCVALCAAWYEPFWGSGKHVPWRFKRADGDPTALAGLWNDWVDKATGEIHPTFTLLTINADEHPVLKKMHRPDPTRDPSKQDKRSVVPIALEDVDLWLDGPPAAAAALMRLPAVELLHAGPAVRADPQLI